MSARSYPAPHSLHLIDSPAIEMRELPHPMQILTPVFTSGAALCSSTFLSIASRLQVAAFPI